MKLRLQKLRETKCENEKKRHTNETERKYARRKEKMNIGKIVLRTQERKKKEEKSVTEQETKTKQGRARETEREKKERKKQKM